ncbi:hypothetical protein GCM10012275_25840 [Longimycelium tulufanense]|uniref:DUF4233 domain-containing protein n=1 Tax=Longimycelium tulufanense TaxID=907463 RepID=A0A8J3C839_9PSEU|nr:DUF4233 domain-containing protein [Longimycelium tulufanense]GGM53624.1 hypothetical protein GCM10012275_25840 [Longimycelium tulufanense]
MNDEARQGTGAQPPQGQPPARDPWKGLRGVMAGTLVMEAIVVALALPVVAKLGEGLSSVNGILVIALALAMLLASGVMGRPWGLYVALTLQVLMVLTVFISVTLGVLGVIFALIWVYMLYLRKQVEQHIARGQG